MNKIINKKKHECHIMDGKKIADDILSELKPKIDQMDKKPGLAAILIGDDSASILYVKNKEKASLRVGINFHKYLISKECCENTTEKDIIEMLDFFNRDNDIDAIIVQLPLPKKFNADKIISTLDPKKDVDGFHPENHKKYVQGKALLTPPLIKTILKILKEHKLILKNKKALIVVNSDIFKKSLLYAMDKTSAHIRILDSQDKNLKKEMKMADLIVSIVGKPGYIKGSMIKQDAMVIDIGIRLTKNGFRGDADAKMVMKKASFFTPTPGGVGPITVAELLENTYLLAKSHGK